MLACVDGEIGVAHRRGRDPHDGFAWSGLARRLFRDVEAPRLGEQCGAAHVISSIRTGTDQLPGRSWISGKNTSFHVTGLFFRVFVRCLNSPNVMNPCGVIVNTLGSENALTRN